MHECELGGDVCCGVLAMDLKNHLWTLGVVSQDLAATQANGQRILKLAWPGTAAGARGAPEWLPSPLQALYSKALSDQRVRLQTQASLAGVVFAVP